MATIHTIGIHEILRPDRTAVLLPGDSKKSILDGLIDLLAGDPRIENFGEMRAAILKREEIMSTGVGKGLALPHARTDAANELAAVFATTEKPIPFESIDDQPVRLLFLLVSTHREKTLHIKLLSRVSRLMNEDGFRDELLRARMPEDIISVFKKGEKDLL